MAKYKEQMPPKVLQVLTIIGYELNVSVEDMKARIRKKHIVEARHFAIHILFNHIFKRRVSLPRLGGWMNRDHTSVIHAIRNVDAYLDVYPEIQAKYNKIKKLTISLAENKLGDLTVDERIMRLPESDRASIMAYIENIEKKEEIEEYMEEIKTEF